VFLCAAALSHEISNPLKPARSCGELNPALTYSTHLIITGKPLWVSFTLEDSSAAVLRSREPLAGAIRPLLTQPHLQALLVNCCAPAAVTAALPVLGKAAPAALRVGAYANGFRVTTSEWLGGGVGGDGGDENRLQRLLEVDESDYSAESGIITPAAYARHAAAWRREGGWGGSGTAGSAGASIIGGCCGVGPEHIKALVERLGGA